MGQCRFVQALQSGITTLQLLKETVAQLRTTLILVTHDAAYELTDVSVDSEYTYAYLTGQDPTTGQLQTYADFRFEGLDPIAQESVTLDGLYRNNSGNLRVNPLAFPPVGDTAQVMEIALSGVLIGMSACASFQLYLQSMRRRKQKISTLIAIGATDGQVVLMVLIEVAVLPLLSAPVGYLLGLGISVFPLPHFMQVTVSVNLANLLTGTLCNATAILVGAILPIFKILRESRSSHKKHAKTVIKYAPQQKHTGNHTGYHRIWIRLTVPPTQSKRYFAALWHCSWLPC